MALQIVGIAAVAVCLPIASLRASVTLKVFLPSFCRNSLNASRALVFVSTSRDSSIAPLGCGGAGCSVARCSLIVFMLSASSFMFMVCGSLMVFFSCSVFLVFAALGLTPDFWGHTSLRSAGSNNTKVTRKNQGPN